MEHPADCGGSMARWIDNVYRQSELSGYDPVLYARLRGTGIPRHVKLAQVLRYAALYGLAKQLPAIDVRLDGWLFLLACYRHLAKHDVLHVHGRPHYPLILRRLGYANPILFHFHRDLSGVSESFAERLAASCSTLIFCSHAHRYAFVETHPSCAPTAVVLYNGADPSVFRPLPSADKQKASILFVGHLGEDKGIHLLLEAVEALLPSFPDVVLRIVARDADSEANSRAHAQMERIRHRGARIEFLGEITHEGGLPDLVARSSVVCIPSVCAETFSLVAVEAMLSQTTVVATRSGGLPEVVGKYGIWADKSADSLACALATALGDPVGRAQIAEEARRWALERFTWNRSAAGMTELLETALGHRSSRNGR